MEYVLSEWRVAGQKPLDMVELHLGELLDGLDPSLVELSHINGADPLDLAELVVAPLPDARLDTPEDVESNGNARAVKPLPEDINQTAQDPLEDGVHLALLLLELLARRARELVGPAVALQIDLHEEEDLVLRLGDGLANHERDRSVIVDVAEEASLFLLDGERAEFGREAGLFEDGTAVGFLFDGCERLHGGRGELVSELDGMQLGGRLASGGWCGGGRRRYFLRCLRSGIYFGHGDCNKR